MRIIYGFLFFAFITIEMHGQMPANRPGYNPLIAKLLSLQHKANSNTLKYQKPSAEILQLKQLDESINIYVNYEMDIEIAKDKKKVKNPPKKVMNMDFIYSYRYLIPYSSIKDLNKLLPIIELRNSQRLENIKASNYFLSKGKAKRVKIKKNEIIVDTTLKQLSLTIDEGVFRGNSIFEIEIELKSQYFMSINPTFNTNGDFTRSITISIPSIFKYKLPSDNSTFELQSEEKDTFVLLQLNRGNLDWNYIIKEYWTDCITYTYNVKAETQLLTNVAFKLEKIELPFDKDIGIPLNELYWNEK